MKAARSRMRQGWFRCTEVIVRARGSRQGRTVPQPGPKRSEALAVQCVARTRRSHYHNVDAMARATPHRCWLSLYL